MGESSRVLGNLKLTAMSDRPRLQKVLKTSDPFLDAARICATTFVRCVEIHDELGSTNRRAAELARDMRVELPALVIARRQTAGKGRGEKTWWSAGGALTFSLLLKPAAMGIETFDWPRLSLATGVAICDRLCLEAPQASFRIKWPNDVLLDESKVCGILIESPGGMAPAKDRLILGIGINVNNSWQEAPHDAGPRGIALCDATAKQHDLQTVLVHCLQAIERRGQQLGAGSPVLSETWQRLDWLLNKRIEVQADKRLTAGVCLGIDDDGALLVENDFGQHRLYSGSVRVMEPRPGEL